MPFVVLSAPKVFVMRPPVHVPEEAKVQVPPLPATTKPPGAPVVEVNLRKMPLAAVAPPVVLTVVSDTLSGVLLPELVPVMLTAVALVVVTVPEAEVMAPVFCVAAMPAAPESGGTVT